MLLLLLAQPKCDNRSVHLRPVFSDATQLDVELSRVELRRYRHPHWVTTFKTVIGDSCSRCRVELCRYKRALSVPIAVLSVLLYKWIKSVTKMLSKIAGYRESVGTVYMPLQLRG